MSSVRVPVRRCIACRRRDPQKGLLRFVWSSEKGLVWDREGHEQSRGAYLHAKMECCSKISISKIWQRAFKLAEGEVVKEKIEPTLRIVFSEIGLAEEPQSQVRKNQYGKVKLL